MYLFIELLFHQESLNMYPIVVKKILKTWVPFDKNKQKQNKKPYNQLFLRKKNAWSGFQFVKILMEK